MADQCAVIQEQGHLSDYLAFGVVTRSMSESVRMSDAVRIGRITLIAESGSIADAVALLKTLDVREVGRGADIIRISSQLAVALLERGGMRDRVTYRPIERILEQGIITDALRLGGALYLTDGGVLGDATWIRKESSFNIIEQGNLRDAVKLYQWATIAEQGHVREAVGVGVSGRLVEAGTLADRVSVGSSTSASMVVTMRGADTVTLRVDAFAHVEEQGHIEDVALPPASGAAWTTNTDTWAASRYVGFRLESLAVIDGRLYGAGDGGLYALDGDDDAGAPIVGSLTTGQHRSKGPGIARGGYLYAPMMAARAMQVRVLDTAAGAPGANTYPFEGRHAEGLAQMRAKFGKGVRSLTWQFQVGNVDGGAFSIPSGLNWVIDPGSRRV